MINNFKGNNMISRLMRRGLMAKNQLRNFCVFKFNQETVLNVREGVLTMFRPKGISFRRLFRKISRKIQKLTRSSPRFWTGLSTMLGKRK